MPNDMSDDKPSRFPGTADAFAPLEAIRTSLEKLQFGLEDILEFGGVIASRQARNVIDKINGFAPSVTFLGQSGTGKTSLVNAFVGMPGLLPCGDGDGTLAVTEIHLGPVRRRKTSVARFTLISEDDLDNLAERALRFSTPSERDEVTKDLQDHIVRWREDGKARFGDDFDTLLGECHVHDSFDTDLIARYVSSARREGGRGTDSENFARLTRRAELDLSTPDLPRGMVVCDTPGMGDGCQISEQMALQAMAESQFCVIVLTMDRPISAADVALIRLVAQTHPRDMLVFVNRMDEPADAGRLADLEAGIRARLVAENVTADMPILFGSAALATQALSDTATLPAATTAGLARWSASQPAAAEAKGCELLWLASGLHALQHAIATRFAEGSGQALLKKLVEDTRYILDSFEHPAEVRTLRAEPKTVDEAALRADFLALKSEVLADFDDCIARHQIRLAARVARVSAQFVSHAQKADGARFATANPFEMKRITTGLLRLGLRISCLVFGTAMGRDLEALLVSTQGRIQELYQKHFDIAGSETSITLPAPVRMTLPAVMGRAILLDLPPRPWWRRLPYGILRAAAPDARQLSALQEETDALAANVRKQFEPEFIERNRRMIAQFLTDQERIILALCGIGNIGAQPAIRTIRPTRNITSRHTRFAAE